MVIMLLLAIGECLIVEAGGEKQIRLEDIERDNLNSAAQAAKQHQPQQYSAAAAAHQQHVAAYQAAQQAAAHQAAAQQAAAQQAAAQQAAAQQAAAQQVAHQAAQQAATQQAVQHAAVQQAAAQQAAAQQQAALYQQQVYLQHVPQNPGHLVPVPQQFILPQMPFGVPLMILPQYFDPLAQFLVPQQVVNAVAQPGRAQPAHQTASQQPFRPSPPAPPPRPQAILYPYQYNNLYQQQVKYSAGVKSTPAPPVKDSQPTQPAHYYKSF